MKKLFLALCLSLGGFVVVNAQDQDTTATQQTQTTLPSDQDRQPIQVSELPEAVTASLESEDYSGWTISSAYRTTQSESSDETQSMEVYAVELKNGADTKTIHFDKDGNKLDDQEQDQK